MEGGAKLSLVGSDQLVANMGIGSATLLGSYGVQ